MGDVGGDEYGGVVEDESPAESPEQEGNDEYGGASAQVWLYFL